jgi:uncharacterized protein with NAD-binding domain and iron-sulfur cluster
MKSTVEIWRDVVGYEDLYMVSNLGNVKNSKGLIFKPSNMNGYKVVSLHKNKIRSQGKVHRLVAMAFPDLVDWTEDAKGKPFDELVVNHKDESRDNNCVDNLEWCTNEYNLNYGTAIERRINNRDLTLLEKPIYQCTLDGRILNTYKSLAECKRITGYDMSLISRVCLHKGNSKTAYGYIWRYA